jgi:copper resistance protein C
MKTALLTTAFLLLATPAFAHAHLELSDPADKATVAAPASLSLTFTEGLELAFSGIEVTGPSGPVMLGAASLSGADHTVLTVVLPTVLAAGTYTVKWHALSTDGHKTTGSYSFVVK